MDTNRRNTGCAVELNWVMVCWWLCLPLLASAVLAAQAPAPSPAGERVAVCQVLKAELSGEPGATTEPADTERIQSALSLCDPGEAVVLAADGAKTAFLAAPLILSRGVKLFVAKGVTLYASRNPHDYDLRPGSCGGPAGEAAVCKPFLFAYQAAFSGVMGEGAIDGQGWAGGAQSAPDLVSSYESQNFSVRGVTLRNAAGVHLSISKTIGFLGENVQIPASSSAGAGVLLSNAQQAELKNFTIDTRATAMDLRASILGATEKVKITGLSIAGGGIHLGDPVYGAVRQIEISVVSMSKAGFTFDLRGNKGGDLRDVKVSSACMQSSVLPLTVEGATALPADRGIAFEQSTVEGQGHLTAAGLQADASVHCSATVDRAASRWELDLSRFRQQGNKSKLTVAQDGSGDFTTIAAAVRALPNTGGEIAVKPGSYREVVTIRKPHVHLYGVESDPAKTVVVFDNTGPKSGGTFNSATVFVEADDVRIDHLSIVNDAGNKGQAVALAVTADRAIFTSLRLLGAQDTLFAAAKYCYGDYGPCVAARQYFRDCFIAGNTDFIFGDSQAVFERCQLHGIAGKNVMFTAQGRHSAEQPSGYVFDHCRLTADAAAETVTLGRPWRPHATVVYLNSTIDAAVIPAGWTEWPRFGQPSLPVAWFAEFQSTGAGANAATREPFAHSLSAAEAESWRAARFLAGSDGWAPAVKDDRKP